MSCQGECNYQQIRGENIIHEAVVTLFTVQLGMFVGGMIDEMMGGWSSGWLERWLGRWLGRWSVGWLKMVEHHVNVY